MNEAIKLGLKNTEILAEISAIWVDCGSFKAAKESIEYAIVVAAGSGKNKKFVQDFLAENDKALLRYHEDVFVHDTLLKNKSFVDMKCNWTADVPDLLEAYMDLICGKCATKPAARAYDCLI